MPPVTSVYSLYCAFLFRFYLPPNLFHSEGTFYLVTLFPPSPCPMRHLYPYYSCRHCALLTLLAPTIPFAFLPALICACAHVCGCTGPHCWELEEERNFLNLTDHFPISLFAPEEPRQERTLFLCVCGGGGHTCLQPSCAQTLNIWSLFTLVCIF